MLHCEGIHFSLPHISNTAKCIEKVTSMDKGYFPFLFRLKQVQTAFLWKSSTQVLQGLENGDN